MDWLESQQREYREKLETLNRATQPLVRLLMEVDMPIRMTMNVKTGEFTKEYSPETQELMDKINAVIEMSREHFFPSNTKH